ncbi:hypothetical protein ECPA14_1308 [Escherichia coli PA14]|nr:hypothetical protein EC93001_1439 [Escherichia coli 93-001]EIN81946.1 hypothetical protein ECPA14_1308 [Escherichia coli PA14]EIO22409.1 hypothetical protein ECPA33_1282 [Escherichia coli PA33]EKH25417.1 hypothetical protein ECFDA507_1329 [Escherichia coli FDA507]EKH46209.1 hypothetical protein ECFRIK1997_1476 [Escherichia coli FRIK1997]EKK33753.1 hypothetical protein EC60172_1435 [Escherichia coli 6.0172]EKW33532.1 hypothetical protein EC950943_1432 [Escherichia coli 95.0943]EKW43670.1 h
MRSVCDSSGGFVNQRNIDERVTVNASSRKLTQIRIANLR